MKLLTEQNGKLSSMRILLLVWFLGVLLVWAAVSWTSKAMATIDGGVVTILGILAGGKTVQRFGEK